MVFGVISSFVVVGDASTLSGSSIALFAVGCTLAVSGTALLGRRKNLDSGRVPRCCLPTSRRGKHHELVSSKDDDEDDDIWSADPSRQKIKSSPHTGYFSPL